MYILAKQMLDNREPINLGPLKFSSALHMYRVVHHVCTGQEKPIITADKPEYNYSVPATIESTALRVHIGVKFRCEFLVFLTAV